MKISTSNINRYINRFERAVRAHEMKGAQHPEDHAPIEEELTKARKSLRQFMIESIISGETIDGNESG